ncbi:MAG: class I SAM-dependent methyltransferase [Bacteroidales bacterium]|jgi:SAM-dependent methyltransferase|nr:class I SAM-dependent methyltransferase [Bacteroidales bacterium]
MTIFFRARRFSAKVFRRTLRLFFGFDRWHTAPLCKRPYAQGIIAFCNRQPVRNSYIEIGCGLGDITRNVRYRRRHGCDIDRHVLNAARFVAYLQFQRNIIFRQFSFPETPVEYNNEHKFDCIVLVNWIHLIPPDVLKANIEKYFRENLTGNGMIIIDTVQDAEYRYNHDIKYLTSGLPCTIEKVGAYCRQREVWAISNQ